MINNKGVTLVELLIVIVVMGIVAGFSIPAIGNLLENTKLGIDQQTVSSLNTATDYYTFYSTESPVFDSESSDEEKIVLLFNNGYLDKVASTQSKNASFEYDEENLTWSLVVDGNVVPLSPYGNSYSEIAPSIIIDMQERLASTGSYGRTWGDYRYTDLGLEPDDWDHSINNIHYKPSGSKLLLRPADGYQFTVYNDANDEFYMTSAYNWNIIYNDLDGNWYFHTITSSNQINIDTLIVEIIQ